MIKTIKVKKQLRLDELIKYAFDNNIKNVEYVSSGGGTVRFNTRGHFELDKYFFIKEDSTFIVEAEVNITEETVFEDIVILHINGISHLGQGVYHSIRSIKRDYPTVTEIHTLINGKLELVWEREEDVN